MGTEEGLKALAEEFEAGSRICKTCLGTNQEEVRKAVVKGTHISYVRPCTDPECGLKKEEP